MSNKSPGLCMECPLRNKNFNSTDSLIMPRITVLQIEVINACNLKCPECIMSCATRRGANGSYMSFETFKDVIDQLAGPLEMIKFYNYGEPFLHKESIRMLEYIKKIDPKISIYISTNGTCISEDKQRSLVDLGVDLLSFSIDGSCQNSCGQYRIGGQLDQMLRNMSGIIQYRENNKKIKPFVTWQYILFNWNDSEEIINRAKEMAVELGVDSLLWILTNTNGASKHYIPGSDNLLELISKEGFEWSPTKFVLATAYDRKKFYQYEDASNDMTRVDFHDVKDCDIEDIKIVNDI